MRMDRYENDLCENTSKQTRTTKNQELYTDVYLNNMYVDINDLKQAMYEIEEEKEQLTTIKEEISNNYNYEDKIYDINILIEEAIKNQKDDKLKRSLDKKVDDLDLENLIESINETQKQRESLKEEYIEKKEKNENLLTDLLPENNDALMIEPIAEPVLDKNDLNVIASKEKDKLDTESIANNSVLQDDSFLIENDKKNKVIVPIIVVIVLILLIVPVVLWKIGVFK